MMMMVMMMTLFSSDCLPHPKITNYIRAAATAFPGEPFETGETQTKRYFLFDQQTDAEDDQEFKRGGS